MNQRLLLAALLGGLVLFAWESVAHLMTPLGELGFKTLDNEAATLPLFMNAIPASGLYAFPAPHYRAGMSPAEKRDAMRAAQDQYTKGPSGMILLRRHGAPAMTTAQLLIQFGADIVAMLIVSLILSQVAASGLVTRMTLILLLSLFPTLRMGLPWENWYRFPKSLIGAQFIEDFVGFALAGLIVAWMVQGRSTRSRTTAAAS
jgi:hypothetical protein